MTIKMDSIARRWRKDLAFRTAYDALNEEFALAQAQIEARARAAGGQGRRPSTEGGVR